MNLASLKSGVRSSFTREPDNQLFSYGLMYVLAWICGFILVLTLFLRMGPYGTPYVIDIWHYMPAAITYMSYGLALIVLPFIVISFFLSHDESHRKRMRAGRVICAILLALSLLYQHIDNEVLRFCDMHITIDFLETYVLRGGVPGVLWSLLAEDAGGSNVSLYLLGMPIVFLVFYFILDAKVRAPKFLSFGLQVSVFIAFFIGLVFVPTLLRTSLFGSKMRQSRVAPPVILIKDAIAELSNVRQFPDDMPERLSKLDDVWTPNSAWTYTDAKYPFYKTHKGECTKPEKPYNVVILSFESFRAYSLKLFNESEAIEATPFLSELAHRPESSYFAKHYTNAHPTIGGFMALHTSLLPHSTQTVAMAFIANHLESFVSLAKANGYQSVYVAGSDPDWDRQRNWANQWYDKVIFRPETDERDRLIMQDAVAWLKSERDPSKPFILTTFFISNHMPFHIIDKDTVVTEEKALPRAILNTMHYDDVVLSEFFDAVKDEPWFDDTIFIVTADHGLDLGDRGVAPDYNNIRAEAMRIPLVIYGKHPRLPRGKQTMMSSHIDVGPTILDLLGICDDNAFMGQSLLQSQRINPVVAYKQGRASVFTDSGSAYMLPEGDTMYYEAGDTWQRNDVYEAHKDDAEKLKKRANDLSLIIDYLYQNNTFYPPKAIGK